MSTQLSAMHRRAVPSLELAHGGESAESFGIDEEPATPVRSRDSFFRSQPGHSRTLLPTSGTLSLVSLILHSLLIGIHVILLGIWAKRVEHRVTFSLKNQKIVSFSITAISTTIGTVYSAALVFVTQTLSTRRSLQREQTLTQTHDNSAAWAGIGSAVCHLWSQKVVPASIIGVLTIFLYLSSVLVLHITTPALFSLETFQASRTVLVETHGLPSYNWSDFKGDILDNLLFFVPQLLSSLPSVFKGIIPALGLHNGTIYDVLVPNEGVGNATVNGTGFNITCGFVSDAIFTPVGNATSWDMSGPSFEPYQPTIDPTQPGLIVPINTTLYGSIIFYSTVPILDSGATPGPTYNLAPPLYNRTSSIQIVGCSLALINQTAIVDSQSRTALTLEPNIEKTISTWSPYMGPLNSESSTRSNFNTTGMMFIDLWGLWYKLIPPSDFPLVPQGAQMLSLADLQLNQMLDLVSGTDRPQNVTLHAFENSLSTIVASMFWALGNIPPMHGFILPTKDGLNMISDTPPAGLAQNPNFSFFFQRPFLLTGNATVTTISIETRLGLSIIAVVAGLTVSIALLLLSLPSSLYHRRNARDLPIEGTGVLHSMWLYRNHRELETLLEQVEDPTHKNLRAAGMVRTTLVGSWNRESFLMTRRGSPREK